MTNNTSDFTSKDSQAMPVEPLAPEYFDIARFEAHAAEADDRLTAFMENDEGVAVWRCGNGYGWARYSGMDAET
jgi:hypothetical protein